MISEIRAAFRERTDSGFLALTDDGVTRPSVHGLEIDRYVKSLITIGLNWCIFTENADTVLSAPLCFVKGVIGLTN